MSASKKAAPLPIVSGRYFFPNAPLTCVNRMPAAVATSVKVMGELAGACADGRATGHATATAAAATKRSALGVMRSDRAYAGRQGRPHHPNTLVTARQMD